ncbi:MAG: MarR family winged helix-turn-helix transcriptional regulator [Sciscionella sp.]
MVTDQVPVPVDGLDADKLAAADLLGHQMVRFVRLVSRIGSHLAAREKDGMESAAYALLALLVLEGPRRATALAEAMHSDTSTISRQSAALVRDGLVERTADPVDGRASLLAATEQGERRFAHTRRQRDRRIALMLDGWSQQELHQLIELLGRLITSLEAFPPHFIGADRGTQQEEGEMR